MTHGWGQNRSTDPEARSPTASAGGFAGPGGSAGGVLAGRRCLWRRRFEIRVKRGRGRARLRSARVYVEGRRVRVRRRGGRLRDTRVYRTCTPKRRRG